MTSFAYLGLHLGCHVYGWEPILLSVQVFPVLVQSDIRFGQLLLVDICLGIRAEHLLAKALYPLLQGPLLGLDLLDLLQ